jgi:ribonuclease HI
MKTCSYPKLIAFTDGGIDKNNANIFSKGSAGVTFVSTRLHEGKCYVYEIRCCTEYAEGYGAVTNSRMELLAFNILASASVMYFSDGEVRTIDVWSDSEYTINILFNTGWSPKKNLDLIKLIKSSLLNNGVLVAARHIRGHKGYFLNELTDYACRRTWQGGKAFEKTIPFKEIDVRCLICKFFPCINGERANKKNWTDAFKLIAKNKYTACDRCTVYVDLESSTQLVGPRS